MGVSEIDMEHWSPPIESPSNGYTPAPDVYPII